MADTLLDVVNENDEVIGQEMRSVIHEKGLMHREVQIWFITPKKEIILQKRSMQKETNPGLLTVAVGGHVESGSSYDQTALIETEEETGLVILKSQLHYFMTRRIEHIHEKTKVRNNVLRAIYGVLFEGSMDDLKIEQGDSDGYAMLSWDEITNPSKKLRQLMSFRLIEDGCIPIRGQLETLALKAGLSF